MASQKLANIKRIARQYHRHPAGSPKGGQFAPVTGDVRFSKYGKAASIEVGGKVYPVKPEAYDRLEAATGGESGAGIKFSREFFKEATGYDARKRLKKLARPTKSKSLAKMSDDEFAGAAMSAAKRAGPSLGKNKVFISRAWAELQKETPEQDFTVDDFKKRLLRANQKRKLNLGRADLAYALDQKDVLGSEIKHQNSVFHFIRLD